MNNIKPDYNIAQLAGTEESLKELKVSKFWL